MLAASNTAAVPNAIAGYMREDDTGFSFFFSLSGLRSIFMAHQPAKMVIRKADAALDLSRDLF
jgi:hypothetical protein